jgi:hypothetical protein
MEHFNLRKRTGAQILEITSFPSPCTSANSNIVHDVIQPQPLSPETWHCQEQLLTSNRSFTSDTSQGPVTTSKDLLHMLCLPLLPDCSSYIAIWSLWTLEPKAVSLPSPLLILYRTDCILNTEEAIKLPKFSSHLRAELSLRNTEMSLRQMFSNFQFTVSSETLFYVFEV